MRKRREWEPFLKLKKTKQNKKHSALKWAPNKQRRKPFHNRDADETHHSSMHIIIRIVKWRAQPVSNLSVLMSMPMIREAPAALQPLMTARPTAPSPHTPHVDPFSTCKHRNQCYCLLSSSLPDPQHQVPTHHIVQFPARPTAPSLTPSPPVNTETNVTVYCPVPCQTHSTKSPHTTCYCPLASSLPDPQHQVPKDHTLTPSPPVNTETETSVTVHCPVPCCLTAHDCQTHSTKSPHSTRWPLLHL